jgi:uncharacterized protein (UPF0333 family)
MKAILSVMKNWKGQRSVEIALIMLLLLLVFSVGGVPMILLSTFTPSWNRDNLEQQKVDRYNIEGLDASVAV